MFTLPNVESMTFLRDEQGKLSLSRILLIAQLLYVDVAAAGAAFALLRLTPEWWAYQATLTVGLVAWAAGPRGLQYIGPVLGRIGQGVTHAAARLARTDDRYRDDERA